jgi:hypothetical protein
MLNKSRTLWFRSISICFVALLLAAMIPWMHVLAVAPTTPGWVAADNHLHTTYSDGGATVSQMVSSAKAKGLNIATITDHSQMVTSAEWTSIGTDCTNNTASDFLCIRGEEISACATSTPPWTGASTWWGHLLAYDIDNWVSQDTTPQGAINAVNAAGGIAVIAHPYSLTSGCEWDDFNVTGYKGIEVWNGTWGTPQITNAFAKWDDDNRAGKHIFGQADSDAHSTGNIAARYNMMYLNSFTTDEFYNAMKGARMYGTDGPRMDFKVDNKMMGSDVPAATGKSIYLSANANGGGTVRAVRLIKNGTVINTYQPNTSTWSYTLTNQTLTQGDFYRIEVDCSSDGTTFTHAFSNPIWISAAASSNLLENPGFESGSTNWTLGGTGNPVIATDFYHSGTKSVNTWSTAAHSVWVEQSQTNCQAGTYTAKMWVRSGVSGGASISQLKLEVYKNGIWYATVDMTPNDTTWRQYSMTNIPVNAGDSVKVQYYMVATAGGAWTYADDFELVKN